MKNIKETPRKSNKYQKNAVNRTQFYDRNSQNVQENKRELPLRQAFINPSPINKHTFWYNLSIRARKKRQKKHFTRLQLTSPAHLNLQLQNLTKEELQSQLIYNRYLRLIFKKTPGCANTPLEAAHRKEQSSQPPRRFHTSAHNTTQTKHTA